MNPMNDDQRLRVGNIWWSDYDGDLHVELQAADDYGASVEAGPSVHVSISPFWLDHLKELLTERRPG